MLGTNDPKLSPVASRYRGINFGAAFPILGALGPVFSNAYDGSIRGGWIALTLAASASSGSITVRFWKKFRAFPTVADLISTSGITCAVLYLEFGASDFKTKTVRRGDVFAVEITAVTSIQNFSGALFITPS